MSPPPRPGRDSWALVAMQAAGAPTEVCMAAEELAQVRGLLGVAGAALVMPGLPQEASGWCLERLVGPGPMALRRADALTDAILWLLTGARAHLESVGDRFRRVLPMADLPDGEHWRRPGLHGRGRETALASLSRHPLGRQAMGAIQRALLPRLLPETHIRGLALAAIVSALPGTAGIPVGQWSQVLDAGRRAQYGPESEDPWLTTPTEHYRVSTWVFELLHRVLGEEGMMSTMDLSRHPNLEDVYGRAQAPLGWVVYAMAMRIGSERPGLDGSAGAPRAFASGWAGRQSMAHRFAIRAVGDWSLEAVSNDRQALREVCLRSLDAFGSGWIHQQLALNLDALWESVHGRNPALDVEKLPA